MTDTVVHGDTAAKLLSLSLALDVAADRIEAGLPAEHDSLFLIAMGKTLVRSMQERGETTDPGPEIVHLWHAAGEFMRSWARHEEPDKAAELRAYAALLDTFRDAALSLSGEAA